MNRPAEIYSELSRHGTRVVVEGHRIQLQFSDDRRPPDRLIEAARRHRDALREMALLASGEATHPFGDVLAALQAKCPEGVVETDSWQQTVADSLAFIPIWGRQAHGLGWSRRDLFGLLPLPKNKSAPVGRRLARYDATGLIWLLQGRSVIALTGTEAAIQRASGGGILVYRRVPATGASHE